MINIVDNFINLKSKISLINNGNKTKIIAVSKTFTIEHIKPLIDYAIKILVKTKSKKQNINGII